MCKINFAHSTDCHTVFVVICAFAGMTDPEGDRVSDCRNCVPGISNHYSDLLLRGQAAPSDLHRGVFRYFHPTGLTLRLPVWVVRIYLAGCLLCRRLLVNYNASPSRVAAAGLGKDHKIHGKETKDEIASHNSNSRADHAKCGIN